MDFLYMYGQTGILLLDHLTDIIILVLRVLVLLPHQIISILN